MGPGRADVGNIPRARGRARRLPGVGCGSGYHRAGVRHRVHFCVAGATWRTSRRDRQLTGSARDRAPHAGAVRLEFPLHLGNAEKTGFPDASFNLVVSEYGASIWCDPYRWIPEAARLLRPGGNLVFLVNGVLLVLCTPIDADTDTPATECLERPYFGMHRFEWRDGSVNFYLNHGDWIGLLRANDFEIHDLIEIQAPAGATTSFPIVTPEWAQKWPSEEIWKVSKR